LFLDDRRNPRDRATFLAEQGTIVKNESGTFLVLENGSVQRQEAGNRDPTMVLFDRYAFDLSKFASSPQTTQYGVREQFLWDLISPDPNDAIYKTQPGQYWAELHDRITAPVYPLAFVIIAYTYLGPPRTTRQSRGLSVASTIVAVSTVRLIGFAATVFSVHYAFAAIIQYLVLALATGLGLYAIGKGVVIEPPAFIANIANALAERMARRAATA
jgi:lipopolysaccharide export system permease protein